MRRSPRDTTPVGPFRGPARRDSGGAAAWLLVALALAACAYLYVRSREKPVEIDEDRVVAVERRDLVKAVLATGRVEPLARVNVMSRASGILKEIYVDEGDVVKRGQVIAELDREQLRAQHEENLGDLAAAEARLLAARARLEEARTRLADPELEFAERNAKRLRELFEAGSASRNELDDAELRLAQVRFRVELVKAQIPILEAEVKQAEADLRSARAAVERSQTALSEATIVSPIDGVVLVRDKDVGDGISSILTAGGNATPVMTLGDTSKMFVEAQVDEVDIGKVHLGQEALVEVDAYRGRIFHGKVTKIAPAGTVDNNGLVTFKVEIAVEDPERLLRVDMTANTRLVLEERPGALALPHKALERDGKGGWFARRVVRRDRPQVERVPVEIGVSDGLMTEIVSGLREGDEVLLPDERRRGMG